MKEKLLEYLVCPDCAESLVCLDADYADGEIKTARLQCCKCKSEYPVLRFIPRILPRFLSADKNATASAFGWEWNKFNRIEDVETYKAQFLDWVLPLTDKDFRDKVVLDAGCGMGRFPQAVASFCPKEVLAVDLSDAVEAAYRNTRHLPNVHVIQADIYHLPFRKSNQGQNRQGDIDVIYSIGVLHHLPDPEKGFHALVEHLNPTGLIAVWVYGYENNAWVIRWINPLRKWFTSKLPRVFLHVLSFLICVPLHVVLKLVYLPARTRQWKRHLPYAAYMMWLSQFGFIHTHHVIFDHLVAPTAFYIKRQDFEHWFSQAGLQDTTISWRNENSWRGCGRCRGGKA